MSDDRDSAYAESDDAIERFADSLGRFAMSLGTQLQAMDRQGSDALERIEECRDRHMARVEELDAEVDAEDSSVSSSAGMAERAAAYAELERLTALGSLARHQHAILTGAVLRLRRLSDTIAPKACSVLRAKANLLQSYQAVRLDMEGEACSSVQDARADVGLPSQGAGTWSDMTEVALPGGFVWVRLSEIALQEELKGVRDAGDFNKVAYDEMKAGAACFMEQVLPLIHKDGQQATSERFAELDREAGLPYEHGMQRVFEAFLGRWTPIYLCRGREGGQFTINNGRHRIKVASDLGWVAVPAQVKDLSNHA